MRRRDRIIIANSGGFWGDDPTAAARQVQGGPIDYLVMDYLAEVTMAILEKQRQRDPRAGYARDLLVQLREVLPACAERGIRIITNAGGVNPLACRDAVESLARDLGLESRVRVGVVLGDDIAGDLDRLIAAGEPLAHMESGRPLADVRASVLSANVYLGAAPIVKALEAGATVIVAGRVTDTAVTLAPLIHEFDWAADDWDRLAAGIVAGHIIECGTQCTGGNFTDWERVPSFARLGYPLVEAHADGSFVVTKHPGTGGLVSIDTVREQLLYEMGAPAYVSPDCVAHFDSIRLTAEGPDRVGVSGVRGGPAPERLKVSISVAQGYRAFGRLMISGPDALAKARKTAEIFWEAAGGTASYEEAVTQYVGWDACHPPLAAEGPGEVLLQVAVRDRDEKTIERRFSPQLVPRVLGAVPGITYLADQGRPRAGEVVGYWPALISREHVRMRALVGGREVEAAHPPRASAAAFRPEPAPRADWTPTGRMVTVPLARLCLARSGDKGDTANIGLLARSPAVYAWMRETITPAFVKGRFAEVCRGEVERYDVPNLLASNFLLHESLGGGGTLSLLLDAQGKTYAQFLLATPVTVDEGLVATVQV